jgi:hypothetical protein
MIKSPLKGPPPPRYEAGPFKGSGDRAWMVYDELAGRLVAIALPQHEAYTLAHTLNVADLSAPVLDFHDVRWAQDKDAATGGLAWRKDATTDVANQISYDVSDVNRASV